MIIVRNADGLAEGKEKKWDFEHVAHTVEQGYTAWCSQLVFQGSNRGRVFMRIKGNQYMRIKLQQLCFLSCVSKMANVVPYSQSVV